MCGPPHADGVQGLEFPFKQNSCPYGGYVGGLVDSPFHYCFDCPLIIIITVLLIVIYITVRSPVWFMVAIKSRPLLLLPLLGPLGTEEELWPQGYIIGHTANRNGDPHSWLAMLPGWADGRTAGWSPPI